MSVSCDVSFGAFIWYGINHIPTTAQKISIPTIIKAIFLNNSVPSSFDIGSSQVFIILTDSRTSRADTCVKKGVFHE